MRMRITYANTMATIALLLSCGGTAYAAVVLTTTNVADRSITTIDIKDGTLQVADLTPAARRALFGAKGATGRAGGAGPQGPAGENGVQGPRGSAAFMTSAFAFRDTGLVLQREGAFPPNDNQDGLGRHWDAPDYADAADPAGINQISLAGHLAINLDNTWKPVVSLTGMTGTGEVTRSTDTLLRLTFPEAFLNATASLALLHRRNGDDFSTESLEGTLLHGRAQCRLFFGTGADPTLLTTPAGVTAMVSSGYAGIDHEIVNMALNGNSPSLVAGTEYNVTVKCRDADYSGLTQWQVARGNLTALASQ